MNARPFTSQPQPILVLTSGLLAVATLLAGCSGPGAGTASENVAEAKGTASTVSEAPSVWAFPVPVVAGVNPDQMNVVSVDSEWERPVEPNYFDLKYNGFRWSRDGKTLVGMCEGGLLVFRGNTEAPVGRLYLTGENPWGSVFSRVIVSPDGSQLATYELGNVGESHVVPLNGPGPANVDELAEPLLGEDVGAVLLDWSPDGREILYRQSTDGNPLTLMAVDVASKATRQILPDGVMVNDAYDSKFSPDGRWIAATLTTPRVGLIPTGGGDIIELPALAGMRVMDWSPDGRALWVLGDDHQALVSVPDGQVLLSGRAAWDTSEIRDWIPSDALGVQSSLPTVPCNPRP